MASNANDVAINMTNLAENNENASNSNSGRRPSRTLSPNRADQPRPTARSRSRSPRVPRSTDTTTSTVPLLGKNDAEEFSPDGDPPMANPEMDDDEFQDERPNNGRPQAGVDDGFYPDEPRRRNNGPPLNNGGTNFNTNNGENPRSVGPFPYGPNFTPQGVLIPPRVIPDVNEYQNKKTLAQGMMDLALLSANANQLRYVLAVGVNHPYYYVGVIFISISIILQVAVGVGLIWNSRYNVKSEDDICKADRISNYTIIGIFLITIVNVFIASFGVAGTNT